MRGTCGFWGVAQVLQLIRVISTVIVPITDIGLINAESVLTGKKGLVAGRVHTAPLITVVTTVIVPVTPVPGDPVPLKIRIFQVKIHIPSFSPDTWCWLVSVSLSGGTRPQSTSPASLCCQADPEPQRAVPFIILSYYYFSYSRKNWMKYFLCPCLYSKWQTLSVSCLKKEFSSSKPTSLIFLILCARSPYDLHGPQALLLSWVPSSIKIFKIIFKDYVGIKAYILLFSM